MRNVVKMSDDGRVYLPKRVTQVLEARPRQKVYLVAVGGKVEVHSSARKALGTDWKALYKGRVDVKDNIRVPGYFLAQAGLMKGRWHSRHCRFSLSQRGASFVIA